LALFAGMLGLPFWILRGPGVRAAFHRKARPGPIVVLLDS